MLQKLSLSVTALQIAAEYGHRDVCYALATATSKAEKATPAKLPHSATAAEGTTPERPKKPSPKKRLSSIGSKLAFWRSPKKSGAAPSAGAAAALPPSPQALTPGKGKGKAKAREVAYESDEEAGGAAAAAPPRSNPGPAL